MLEQDILKHPTSILSAAQREQYFEEGAVLVEGAVPEVWLKRLRAASDEIIERSRAITESTITPTSGILHRALQPSRAPPIWLGRM
jgi:hypothetical protein